MVYNNITCSVSFLPAVAVAGTVFDRRRFVCSSVCLSVIFVTEELTKLPQKRQRHPLRRRCTDPYIDKSRLYFGCEFSA